MPEQNTILYFGDTALAQAAAYLAGLIERGGWKLVYLPSDACGDETIQMQVHSAAAVILSDYPATQLSAAAQGLIGHRVAGGMGLLMIGGWESFAGMAGTGGHWQHAALAELLPVGIRDEDDRVNWDGPAFVQPADEQAAAHVILAGLPWHSRPPLIGGYNRVTTAAGATCLLEVRACRATWRDNQPQLHEDHRSPLLVTGTYGQGRTACLMTDLAPHWIGPMVDWGTQRVAAQARGGEAVEVGSDYAQFVTRLLTWITQQHS